MLDKHVVKGNYHGIKIGNLVVVKRILSDDVSTLIPGDVGVVLEKTFVESHLGDEQTFLSPVLVVLAKGKRCIISPSSVNRVEDEIETEEI
jgi:hypothetical protein